MGVACGEGKPLHIASRAPGVVQGDLVAAAARSNNWVWVVVGVAERTKRAGASLEVGAALPGGEAREGDEDS